MIRILRSGKILFSPQKGGSAAAALGWDTEAIPELELKPNRLGTALTGTGWPCAWNARRPGAGGISAGTAFLPRMPA